jgi:hypothetical protein
VLQKDVFDVEPTTKKSMTDALNATSSYYVFQHTIANVSFYLLHNLSFAQFVATHGLFQLSMRKKKMKRKRKRTHQKR